MATIHANYKAIALASTMGLGELGDGVSANTVHRLYCISPGNITVRPFEGASFTWTAPNANDFIDVVVSGLTVNSGTFIGFAAKGGNITYRGNGPY